MKKLSLLIIFLIISFICLSQVSGKGSGYAKLGAPVAILGNDNLFASPKPRQLEMMHSSEESIYRPGNAGAVGGVAFEKTASPEKGLQVKNIEINYVKNNEDGNRLQVIINGKPVECLLPDWQAIPIAMFANSEYNACFTAFGQFEKQDTALSGFIYNKKGKILNYHPAFENNLLGLRLMQTDILLMSNNSADLPKSANKKYILGKGESEPDVEQNKRGFQNLYYHLKMSENNCNISYRSYIICDYKQDIRFSINDNKLSFSGQPYYYCWRYKMDMQGFNADSANNAILKVIQNALDTLPRDFNIQQNWVLNELLPELEAYKKDHYVKGMGEFYDQVFQLSTTEEQKSLLQRYDIQSLANLLLDIRRTKALRELIYLECLSDELSSKPEYLKKTNPAVWNAVQNTMWYAAFFTYCKKNFPANWSKFISQVSNLKTEPEVITPGVWIPAE